MVIKIGKLKLDWIDILMIMLIILVVYMLLTILFGKSATPIEVTIGLFGILVNFIYRSYVEINNSLNRLNREFGEFKVKVINSFGNLKKDINQIKRR